MVTVNMREAKNCIQAVLSTGQSITLMGHPGIGKTDIFKQVAQDLGWSFLCFEASSLDPTDVRGLCVPDKNNTYFTGSPMMPDVKRHGKEGILLIDELPSGLPAVQVALHALFHPDERRLGEHKIPEGWVPAATGNYASDGAGASNILTAISDRMPILNVEVDQRIWKEDYAYPKNLHPITIGFTNFRPDLLSNFSKRAKGVNGKTFASPRSHAMASKILYYADKHQMAQNELMACLAGCLGDGVASELIAFRKTYKELPDVKKVFKGEDIVPSEPSITFALCSAIIAHLKEVDMTPQAAINRVLEYSTKLDAEFGGLLIRDLYSDKARREFLIGSPVWTKVAKRYF